jgi:glycosyltransferase involved in cell wall biosynthesis
MIKIAVLTNLIAPYRIPMYVGLGLRFETVLAVGGREPNRTEWTPEDPELIASGVQVCQIPGLMIKRSEDRYLHINPGYLSFLFREHPDAVISSEMGFRTLCAIIYTRATRKPLWIWSEGTTESEMAVNGLKRAIRKVFTHRSHRWITFGDRSTDYLLRMEVDRAKILQLQNGVDEKNFAPCGPTAKVESPRPLLLVVGQLIERKGLHLLLPSVQRLQRMGMVFSLRFVGSGPRLSSLKEFAASENLKNVEFLGGLAPSEIASQYRCADAVVFPTLNDVWGLVANEALLCGTPVICSKYAGCSTDLFEPQDVFDPLNPDDMDRALTRAVKGELGKPDLTRIWPMDRIVGTLCNHIELVLKPERDGLVSDNGCR